MLDHLRAMAVFSAVAEAGSFRAAAGRLGISPSVVSHHVTALERHLDTPLIYRSTRRLSLTDAGRRLAVSAQAMVRAAEEGYQAIGHEAESPSGMLRVTAPAVFQYALFVKRVAEFMKQHPKVEISVNFSDRWRNLVEEGLDLAFRIGPLRDSSLKARKLVDGRQFLCASPSYLKVRPVPKTPADLDELEMIGFAGRSYTIGRTGKGGKGGKAQHRLRMPGRLVVDSGFAAMRLAEEGCGATVLPDFLARAPLEAGRLVEVLPGWTVPGFGIYAVWPDNPGTNTLRALFVDFIAQIGK
ncbi:LysR family transcriptional regulator [Hoeflea poritis]|uniref:LysR family transcriptional regulator n=1 Tax=Hoeflea poritis TaxID=2993659 RepID=A0ABT4VKX7_9HYPH|nr:LysR family transcriptional regulator [Hoeflea poritis]MDA4844762.1 LysR family transcriptional regulator [Hoeflea poritis]